MREKNVAFFRGRAESNHHPGDVQPAEANPVPGDVQPEPYDSFLYLNLTGPALPVRFL